MDELSEKIAKYITGIIMRIEQKEWHYSDWEDALPMAKKILTLIRESGLFMDVEMVKGLMFEAQAKKCSQCLKNREEKDYEWECEMQHRKEQSETP